MKQRLKRYTKQLNLLPGYIVIGLWVLFTFVAFLWVLAASFSTSAEIFSDHMFRFETGVHFENYIKAWKTQKVSVYFMNSLLYTLSSCFLVVAVAAPAAYVLSRFRFRGSKLIYSAIAAALGVPIIMIIIPLFGVTTTLGIGNSRPLIIFLYTAKNVPFTCFFLISFFRNLSFTFEEAAAIDGCSPIKTFWKVMLPLTQPGIITVSIFNFIAIWNEYFMSLIFANKSSLRPVAVGLFNMVQSMRYTGDWGGLFASVMIVLLPTVVLYVVLSEKIIAGVTGGAIKG